MLYYLHRGLKEDRETLVFLITGDRCIKINSQRSHFQLYNTKRQSLKGMREMGIVRH